MTFGEWYDVQSKWTASEITTNGWSIIFQTLYDTMSEYELIRDLPIWEKLFESRLKAIKNEFGDIINGTTLADLHAEYSASSESTMYGNALNDTVIGDPTTAVSRNKIISADSSQMLKYIRARYGSITVEDFIKARFKDLFLLVY